MPVHFLLSEPADSSAASSFSAFWTCRFFCNQFIFYFLNLQILLQPVYFLLFELADSSATSLFSAFWTCRFFCNQFIFYFLNLQILLQPVYFLLSELAASCSFSTYIEPLLCFCPDVPEECWQHLLICLEALDKTKTNNWFHFPPFFTV